MAKSEIFIEHLPLKEDDCFLVRNRHKNGFEYPLHVHNEFELSYLENVKGAVRVVGDSYEELLYRDLLLVAGGTSHGYTTHNWQGHDFVAVTIQFPRSLFDSFLNKRHFNTIRMMFDAASSGLVFSSEVVDNVRDKLIKISNDDGDSFKNLLNLIEILKVISLDKGMRRLNPVNTVYDYNSIDSKRLDSIMVYLHNNFNRTIQLQEIASLTNMSIASFMRIMKKWTGKTFVESLNDIRIHEASSMLADTNCSVSEICYKCGFNNLSNFNRIFRDRKGCSPSEYRKERSSSHFYL